MGSTPVRISPARPEDHGQDSSHSVHLESARKRELANFLRTTGIKFKNPELLNLSFMHRSISNEHSFAGKSGGKINNERLEFLGDSILGAVCATLLYQKFPDKNEGELAKIKSVVVSEEILSAVALGIQIDTMMILGHGEELSGGRTKRAILADAMEALIGALYLDSGYKAAFDFVSRCLIPEIARVTDTGQYRDYKSLLQELCQQRFHSYPEYRLVKKSGPEHARIFWIQVTVNGSVYGPATGHNKKTAEQEAARKALEAYA